MKQKFTRFTALFTVAGILTAFCTGCGGDTAKESRNVTWLQDDAAAQTFFSPYLEIEREFVLADAHTTNGEHYHKYFLIARNISEETINVEIVANSHDTFGKTVCEFYGATGGIEPQGTLFLDMLAMGDAPIKELSLNPQRSVITPSTLTSLDTNISYTELQRDEAHNGLRLEVENTGTADAVVEMMVVFLDAEEVPVAVDKTMAGEKTEEMRILKAGTSAECVVTPYDPAKRQPVAYDHYAVYWNAYAPQSTE